jgi:lipoate-protein ligase A
MELTYAVVTSPGYPLYAGNVRETYRAISLALANGLRMLGVQVESAPRLPARDLTTDMVRRQNRQDVADWGRTPSCFDLSSDHELCVAGRKLVGSAQLRRDGAVLQHGSILLDIDLPALLAVLRLDQSKLGEIGPYSSSSVTLPRQSLSREIPANALSARMIGLREALGREVGFEEVAEALTQGFKHSHGLEFLQGTLTKEEIALAHELREAKYRSDHWTHRR